MRQVFFKPVDPVQEEKKNRQDEQDLQDGLDHHSQSSLDGFDQELRRMGFSHQDGPGLKASPKGLEH